MDLVEQVRIFVLSNIHTFGLNIILISLFSLKLNCAKPRMFQNIITIKMTFPMTSDDLCFFAVKNVD